MASGSAATLAMLAIVPTRVASQAIAQSSCQEVVRSGAEMSRGQIEKLLATPEGTAREAVRQIIETPYCLLPAIEAPEKVLEKAPAAPKSAEDAVAFADSVTVEVEREAYPLAFDPEAWVVVNYAADEYVGYDFVFKP